MNNSWPGTLKQSSQLLANAATRQAPSTPPATPIEIHNRSARNTARGRQHDADDQAGLYDFAKYDQKTGEHYYSATTTPCAVSA